MYRLFNYLLITILLSLVFSSKYKLTAHNDANDIRNSNNDVNRMLTNNEPKDTNLNGHRDASFNFKRSPSGPVTSPLSPSPVNVDASVKLPSHALTSSSSSSISPSSSTPISDQKSDDVGVDNKFYRTLCSTNRMQSCQNLSIDCLDCDYDYNCDFGEVKSVTCRVKEGIECQGPKQIHHNYTCAYCYQFPEKNYYCSPSFACRVNSRYLTDCNMKSHVLCLGNRSFQRYKICNFVSGYKWSTALLLSVTLGGFGIDRFYLGYWQEGIGKLFSFGGFGVWTLVDIILIATGYLKPADGSRYINDFSFS